MRNWRNSGLPRKKEITKKFKLPSEVAVFPLPHVVLFPQVELPLFIFEPRYRQMLTDTLAGSKLIAISLFRRGWEKKKEPFASYETASVGYVKAVIENEDGTSHILLRGIERVRITRYVQMEPYRIARIRPVPDVLKDPKELKDLAQTLRSLFLQRLQLSSEAPNEKMTLPKELNDPVTLSHYTSFMAQVSPYLKQDILETTNVNCRLKHLITLLQEEIFPSGTQN